MHAQISSSPRQSTFNCHGRLPCEPGLAKGRPRQLLGTDGRAHDERHEDNSSAARLRAARAFIFAAHRHTRQCALRKRGAQDQLSNGSRGHRAADACDDAGPASHRSALQASGLRFALAIVMLLTRSVCFIAGSSTTTKENAVLTGSANGTHIAYSGVSFDGASQRLDAEYAGSTIIDDVGSLVRVELSRNATLWKIVKSSS